MYSYRKFKNRSSTRIGGCILLLQIIYFHRVIWRGIPPPASLPLIQHWTEMKMTEINKQEVKSGGYGAGMLSMTKNGVLKSLHKPDGPGPVNDETRTNFEEDRSKEIHTILMSLRNDADIFLKKYQHKLLHLFNLAQKVKENQTDPPNESQSVSHFWSDVKVLKYIDDIVNHFIAVKKLAEEFPNFKFTLSPSFPSDQEEEFIDASGDLHESEDVGLDDIQLHFSRTIPKNFNFEVDHSSQRGQEVKYIDFQLQDQHSSSTESTSLSHKEYTAMGKTSSQDQCASSDSVHDESYGKHGRDMKAALYLSNPELSVNASQAEITPQIVQFPYAYADPYYNGLFTAYGPHNIMQPQMMAAASGRVPLPVDLPEDGPIFVNAKQYHGILRRRQTRAKMEAQNKLVKTRKPYLHESRHQHALNRVRGSGGRFLSSKKQQSDSAPPVSSQSSGSNSFHFTYINHVGEANKYNGPSGGEGTSGDGMLQQSDGRFASMAVPMQGGGGLVYNGNRHYASIVR